MAPLTARFHSCPTDADCPFCGHVTDRSEGLDWSFIDAAYCISLQSRDDRTQSVARELHRVGLCRHTLFFRPIRHPKSSKIGVWESHQAVARHALENHHQRVLILEDDVVFNRSLGPRTLRRVRRAMDNLPADWMSLYLGHWAMWMRYQNFGLMRSGSLCAHAYIASERLLRWLDENPFSKTLPRNRLGGKGIDAALAVLPSMYSLFPMIAGQSDSPSDHIKPGSKRKKLSNYITHSHSRNILLSKLMRPNEIAIFILSPLILLGMGVYRGISRLGGGR